MSTENHEDIVEETAVEEAELNRRSAEGVEVEEVQRRGFFSRRRFLKLGGIALGGTVLGVYFGRHTIRRTLYHVAAEAGGTLGISNFNPDVVFEMLPDNRLQINLAKAEMGQGIFTGMAMLAAEELDVSMENIVVKPANSLTGMVDQGTGGSATMRGGYVVVRELAATFREMLKTSAAKQWGVDVAQLTTEDGFVINGNDRISYFDVVDSTDEWEIPDVPELRPRSSFKVIGTDQLRVDLKEKVMGAPIFGLDGEIPNMLYANLLKCPYIDGALESMDVAAAKAFPGVVDVVELDGLIAVVAENRYAAEMGKRKLNAQWNVSKIWQQSEIDERITVGSDGSESVNLLNNGNANRRIDEDGGTVIEAEYRVPTGVHAQMEPHSATVDVRDNSALVITATQAAGNARSAVASVTGIDADNIEVRTGYLGGGFGRKFATNPSGDAARLSQHLKRPVQVVWDRETEFLCGLVRPATHHKLRAKLDESGKLIAMDHQIASGDQILGMFEEILPVPLPLKAMLGGDIVSAGHGAAFLYDIENGNADFWHIDLPYRTSIWRGVGLYPNGYAIESFMDEVAHAAGRDPFDLRFDHLPVDEEKHERWGNMLRQLREESGWDSEKPADVGRGVAIIEDRITVAAAVIEVKIVDGKIRLTKVTSAIDPGVVINPDGVRQQVEGCVMMGLSAALYEDDVVRDGKFTASNYSSYPMAMLSDTPPEINVMLIEGSDIPTGVGEPPIAPIAPAIANAVFDLTGIRLRNMPLQKAYTNAVA